MIVVFVENAFNSIFKNLSVYWDKRKVSLLMDKAKIIFIS